MQATILIFERKTYEGVLCVTLHLGPETCRRFGRNMQKTHAKLVDDVRTVLRKAPPSALMRYEPVRGAQIVRVRLQLTLGGARERRKIAGLYPVVVEPRWVTAQRRVSFAFHPLRPEEVVPVRDDEALEPQLRSYFQRSWADLSGDELVALGSHGRERLHFLSFSFTPRSPKEDLPADQRDGLVSQGDPAFGKRRRRGLRVLPDVGLDLTERAIRDDLDGGTLRPRLRDQLRAALTGPRPASVVLIGPPRSGKTTLVRRLVHDLLEDDGYDTHHDAQRVRHVWRISGRRLIAGMSRVGEWENRCVQVVDDARSRVVLVVDDLHAFGRIGRSRQSDRSLSDVFRGPLVQREIVMIGECTADQWRRVQQEAPAFHGLFTQVTVPEADRHETFRLLVQALRNVERDHRVEVDPSGLRAVVDLSESVISHEALPGKALDMLEDLGRTNPGDRESPRRLGETDVIRLVSRRTGVPASLLRSNEALDPAVIEADLAARVIGQDQAIARCTDRVMAVKSRLVDPRRPYGVLLFTGPTGVGKTELAKALAEVLYGSDRRVVRLDMGEYGGPDAAARLIGDRWRPEGALTRQVQQQPFCLLLLDEIEKAHPLVHGLLLQLFEDGRLTDAAGRVASFRHCMIVMTSNLGARPKEPIGFGSNPEGWMREIAGAVRAFFSPELFNRIDAIVPFRPIDARTAKRVADKELGKLLARRGLTERNVVVQVSDAVIERVAREAYAPLDGARAIKRSLEERMAGLLTDVLSTGERSALTLLRVGVGDAGFTVDRESLQEAPALPARWPMERLIRQPRPALVAELARMRPRVAELEQGPDLAHLSDRLSDHLRRLHLGDRRAADAIYDIDAVRAAVRSLRERIDELCAAEQEEDYEAIERRQFAFQTHASANVGEYRVRLLEPRTYDPNERRASRYELLVSVGEALALFRAVELADDPDQHAVVIHVTDIGPARRVDSAPGLPLLTSLARRYGRVDGTLDRWALADAKGHMHDGIGPATLESCGVVPTDVVLRVVGPCVADFFAPEHGVHVWMSHYGPQIVRVEVGAAVDREPDDLLAGRLAARERFRNATEPGHPNPDALLPLVRRVHYDPPVQGGGAPMQVEDYPTGFAATYNARRIEDAWDPVWLIRTAREDLEEKQG